MTDSKNSKSADINSGFAARLRGVITAMVTPFSEDSGTIDYESVDRMLDRQIKAGVSGLVIAGSTGEAATLSDVEYGALVRYVVDRAEGKILCIAGVNSSSTARAVELAVRATDSGAEGLLLVTPPYNKPTQAGIIRHFEEVYKATHRPIVAYNIPGRAVSFFNSQTVAQLASDGIIVGLKESSGSVDNCLDFFSSAPAGFPVLCGDDSLALAIFVHGGQGVVSVASNIAPHGMVRLSNSAMSGDFRQARLSQFELLPLIRALYTETNPIAVKAAMKIKGVISHSSLRLPLTDAVPATLEKLERLFAEKAFE